MKVTVRLRDEFEGPDLLDIAQQVLGYLEKYISDSSYLSDSTLDVLDFYVRAEDNTMPGYVRAADIEE